MYKRDTQCTAEASCSQTCPSGLLLNMNHQIALRTGCFMCMPALLDTSSLLALLHGIVPFFPRQLKMVIEARVLAEHTCTPCQTDEQAT